MKTNRLHLEAGNRYRVTKPGAGLHWREPSGVFSWRGRTQTLRAGDVLVYDGSPMGFGSDSVPEDTFTCERTGARGSFFPSCWGCADTDYLEELPVTGR